MANNEQSRQALDALEALNRSVTSYWEKLADPDLKMTDRTAAHAKMVNATLEFIRVWYAPMRQALTPVPDEKSEGFNSDTKIAPNVFLQWKGTDACFDFYCDCGAYCHFDGFFAHKVKCPHCQQTWEMPWKLFPRKADEDDLTKLLEADEDFNGEEQQNG